MQIRAIRFFYLRLEEKWSLYIFAFKSSIEFIFNMIDHWNYYSDVEGWGNFQRIQTHKSIQEIVIGNSKEAIIRSTDTNKWQYAGNSLDRHMSQLISKQITQSKPHYTMGSNIMPGNMASQTIELIGTLKMVNLNLTSTDRLNFHLKVRDISKRCRSFCWAPNQVNFCM